MKIMLRVMSEFEPFGSDGFYQMVSHLKSELRGLGTVTMESAQSPVYSFTLNTPSLPACEKAVKLIHDICYDYSDPILLE